MHSQGYRHGRGRERARRRALLVLLVLVAGVAVIGAWAAASAASDTSTSAARDTSAGSNTTIVAEHVRPGRPSAGGVASVASTGHARARPAPDRFRDDLVLVGFRSGVSPAQRNAIERAAGGESDTRLGPAIRPGPHGAKLGGQQFLSPLKLRVPAGRVPAVVSRLRRNPAVAYAEPDYLMHASAMPNDPSFSLQWGDSNTGQAIPTQEAGEVLGAPAHGAPGADDRALAAWGVGTGSRSIVIGETDTGVDYEHPDLAANIWSNPGGIGGCASGTHGYNVVARSCNPMDDDTSYGGHGTHVAGIMGALGNNGTGVAGLNWQTTILPVKWLKSNGWGETSGLIEALQWLVAAKQAGVNVRVVNDSATFAGTAFSQALSNEIDTLGANGILFVTAAGNSGQNNDELAARRYPCGYDRPTEICVTAIDNNDLLPSWANYGSNTVDLAAPGVSIYSTLRGAGKEAKYGYLSGGSMASPQVAGAAGLILSVEPSLSAPELKADILNNVDKLPSLSGRVITGGALDVCKALPGCKVESSEPAPQTGTFGKTTVGAHRDGGMYANYKIVHVATLPVTASVTKLSVYATPGASSPSPQALKAVIYADSGGAPGALVATGTEVSYKGDTNGSGWFDLPLPSPVTLGPGKYWLGFITGATSEGIGYAYDEVANSRAYNANSFASGPTNPFGSFSKDSEQASIYATYTTGGSPPPPIAPPVNRSAPTISGSASVGQTLSANAGSWSESPTGYAYQWQRCSSGEASCAAISGASAQTFAVSSSDVGSTLRVLVTASNSAGPSAPASSSQTAVVPAPEPPPPPTGTFGKTTVGASFDEYAANRKRISRYSLPAAGAVGKLSIYLEPTGYSGQQPIEGIVYADSAGKPAALLGTTSQLTFHSTDSSGWYALPFPTPLRLSAGSFWIGVITGASSYVAGFRYDSVAGARDVNANTFTSGPSNPFGSSFTTDSEQTSLYATYTPE